MNDDLKNWRVRLARDVCRYERLEVVVQAETEKEAEKVALQLHDEEGDWNDEEWEFWDAEPDEISVVDVKPEEEPTGRE